MQMSHLCLDCQTTLIGAPKRDAAGRVIEDGEDRDRAQDDSAPPTHGELWHKVDVLLQDFDEIAGLERTTLDNMHKALSWALIQLMKQKESIGGYVADLSDQSLEALRARVRDSLVDLRDSADMLERLDGTKSQQARRAAIEKTIQEVREALNDLVDAQIRDAAAPTMRAIIDDESLLQTLPLDVRNLIAQRTLSPEQIAELFSSYSWKYDFHYKPHLVPDAYYGLETKAKEYLHDDSPQLSYDYLTKLRVLKRVEISRSGTSADAFTSPTLVNSFAKFVAALVTIPTLRELKIDFYAPYVLLRPVVQLTQLTSLSIPCNGSASDLETLTSDISLSLTELQELLMFAQYDFEELVDFGSAFLRMTNLTSLDISSIDTWYTPLQLPPQLVSLAIGTGNDDQLVGSTLPNVKNLVVKTTVALSPQIMQMSSLQSLTVHYDRSSRIFVLEGRPNWPSLKSLKTRNILFNQISQETWAGLGALETLTFYDVYNDVNFPLFGKEVSHLTNLKQLEITTRLAKVSNIQALKKLTTLRHLMLRVPAVDNYGDTLVHLCRNGLEKLTVSPQNYGSVFLDFLSNAPELRELSLVPLRNEVLGTVIDLSGAPKLTTLDLSVSRAPSFAPLPPGHPTVTLPTVRGNYSSYTPAPPGFVYKFTS